MWLILNKPNSPILHMEYILILNKITISEQLKLLFPSNIITILAKLLI